LCQWREVDFHAGTVRRAYVAKRQQAGGSNAEINRELSALKRSFSLTSLAVIDAARTPCPKEGV
jgi:hypothetical protein